MDVRFLVAACLLTGTAVHGAVNYQSGSGVVCQGMTPNTCRSSAGTSYACCDVNGCGPFPSNGNTNEATCANENPVTPQPVPTPIVPALGVQYPKESNLACYNPAVRPTNPNPCFSADGEVFTCCPGSCAFPPGIDVGLCAATPVPTPGGGGPVPVPVVPPPLNPLYTSGTCASNNPGGPPDACFGSGGTVFTCCNGACGPPALLPTCAFPSTPTPIPTPVPYAYSP